MKPTPAQEKILITLGDRFELASQLFTRASTETVWGAGEEWEQDFGLVNIDQAIAHADRGLTILRSIKLKLEEADGSANNSIWDDGPVIRGLPVTDKITPLVSLPPSMHTRA